MDKELKLDFWVSYVYRPRRKQTIYGDAFAGLLVTRDGYDPPDGITRGMITEIRKYLGQNLQVDPESVTVLSIVRLEPEVLDAGSKQVDGGREQGDREGPGKEDARSSVEGGVGG